MMRNAEMMLIVMISVPNSNPVFAETFAWLGREELVFDTLAIPDNFPTNPSPLR